jgi:hypothetical protein
MYEDINGYRLKPVSPKMFRYDIEGHHDTLWENEKGVRYYLATNIVKNTSFYNKLVGNYTTINYRVKKVKPTDKLISGETLDKQWELRKNKRKQDEECQKKNCTNKGLRGEERYKCLRKCGI